MREGGENYLKYLKRGKNRKEGRGNKDFKKVGGRLGQGLGALKRGGGRAGTPLRIMCKYKFKYKKYESILYFDEMKCYYAQSKMSP